MSDFDTNNETLDEAAGRLQRDHELENEDPGEPAQQGLEFRQSRETLKAAVGTDNPNVAASRLNQLIKSFCAPSWMSKEDTQSHFDDTVERLIAFAPQDPQEEMLTSQMISTHNAAMECMRRAAAPEQSFAARDVNLRHAEKLMALYTKQLAALDKHRGKGHQKVTVEHVHVEAGGQAIVGAVEAGPSKKPRQNITEDLGALEHVPEVPLTPVKLASPAKTKRRRE